MVGMELTKILNYTRVSSLGYMYTWIAPADGSGKRDFTIYPASTTTIKGSSHAQHKLQLFLDDSRKLFDRHNKGYIKEILTDSVTVTL